MNTRFGNRGWLDASPGLNDAGRRVRVSKRRNPLLNFEVMGRSVDEKRHEGKGKFSQFGSLLVVGKRFLVILVRYSEASGNDFSSE